MGVVSGCVIGLTVKNKFRVFLKEKTAYRLGNCYDQIYISEPRSGNSTYISTPIDSKRTYDRDGWRNLMSSPKDSARVEYRINPQSLKEGHRNSGFS